MIIIALPVYDYLVIVVTDGRLCIN